MMAITTNNSIRVNPGRRDNFGIVSSVTEKAGDLGGCRIHRGGGRARSDV
jgi:hypothetical protein